MRLGADPEVFLQDEGGNLISSIGFIRADKWNPLQIPDMPDGFTLQEDNVSLEYGIPPASSADEFASHIRAVMERSKGFLPNLSFSKLSCVSFPKEQLNHPAAQVFGCEPDFNAWTGETNPKLYADDPALRSAGGHVHIETEENPYIVGRVADLFLGVPATLIDVDGQARRALYGKHGAIRPKPYGVEYRVLSNFWIFDDKYVKWVWTQTERVLANVGMDIEVYHDRIVEAIDHGDRDVAQALVDEFKMELP